MYKNIAEKYDIALTETAPMNTCLLYTSGHIMPATSTASFTQQFLHYYHNQVCSWWLRTGYNEIDSAEL